MNEKVDRILKDMHSLQEGWKQYQQDNAKSLAKMFEKLNDLDGQLKGYRELHDSVKQNKSL